MQKIAISACLLGRHCRYDGGENLNDVLLEQLDGYELLPFCPEDYCFGTPRPTMDLIANSDDNKAISNLDGKDLSKPILSYANNFFDKNPDIDLFIGKDRSPSCGVRSAKLYDKNKKLLSEQESGIMSKIAKKRAIKCIDAEQYCSKPML